MHLDICREELVWKAGFWINDITEAVALYTSASMRSRQFKILLWMQKGLPVLHP